MRLCCFTYNGNAGPFSCQPDGDGFANSPGTPGNKHNFVVE
jgi:hypothetical protein